MTPVLAVAFALAVAASPGGPSDDVFEPQRKTSPALVLLPRDSRVGVLAVTFRSGIYDDGEKPGLTRLTQHALVGANARLPYQRLVAELFAADATIDIETGVRESTIWLQAPRGSFEGLASKVLDMVFRPRLSPDDLRVAVRRLLLEELSPGQSVAISALVARSVFQDDFRFQNDLLLNRDIVGGISPEELEAHLRDRFCPANAQVVAVGPFDPAKLQKQLARYKGGAPSPELKPKLVLPVDVFFRGRRRMDLAAFPLELRTADDVAHARVVAALTADRVHRELRSRGQAYASDVLVQRTEWLDFLMAVLPTGEKSFAASKALRAEFDATIAGKFSDDDLATNRGRVAAQLAASGREPLRLARELVMAGPSLPWTGPDVAAAVDRVTRESVMAFAARYLDEQRAIQISYSPDRPARR